MIVLSYKIGCSEARNRLQSGITDDRAIGIGKESCQEEAQHMDAVLETLISLILAVQVF